MLCYIKHQQEKSQFHDTPWQLVKQRQNINSDVVINCTTNLALLLQVSLTQELIACLKFVL